MRPLPQLPRGRRHLCISTQGVGVNRDGAFADYVVIPATNAWVQPADLDPDLGALFDPLGNATHTALQWPVVGEDVVVTGAGPIGVMATAIVRHAGARADLRHRLSADRLALAERPVPTSSSTCRAARPCADAQDRLGMEEGFDIGLEMSGRRPAVEDLLANMNHGGRVALLGLPPDRYAIDWGKVITHMITLQGHLRPRDVRDLVPHGVDARDVPSAARGGVVGHHGPLPRRAVGRRPSPRPASGQGGKVVLDWS